MRRPVSYLFGGAFVVLMLSGGLPASAQATVYPWCAHYKGADVGGAINCGFVTWQQCMADVSGIGGTCEMNVIQPPPTTAPRATKRRSATAQ